MIIVFDWLDLGLLLQRVFGDDPVPSQVIEVSCDAHNHRGGSQDHGALPVCDLTLLCETDASVHTLLDALPDGPPAPGAPTARAVPAVDVPPRATEASDGELPIAEVGRVIAATLAGTDVCFTRFPFTWDTSTTHFRHPLDFIGYDGGSGIGSGPGITVGAGLALPAVPGVSRSRCSVTATS